jgi:hypothetical protein
VTAQHHQPQPVVAEPVQVGVLGDVAAGTILTYSDTATPGLSTPGRCTKAH